MNTFGTSSMEFGEHSVTESECTNDTSGQDVKFEKIYTDNEINVKGKKFFQQRDCIDSVYTLENMDRSFIVGIERNCFIRSLEVLELNKSDIQVVKKARELETRKINTQKTRSRQSMELMEIETEVQILEMMRGFLKQEKENLETEICEYKKLLEENPYFPLS